MTAQARFHQMRTIPADMLFASASGVDPHISPEAARLQINRIANVRGFRTEQKAKTS